MVFQQYDFTLVYCWRIAALAPARPLADREELQRQDATLLACLNPAFALYIKNAAIKRRFLQ